MCLSGRNNKFYMAQLIQDREHFVVFRRWGRVGDKSPQMRAWSLDAPNIPDLIAKCPLPPQCSIENHRDSLKSAKSEFKRVFASKSGNR